MKLLNNPEFRQWFSTFLLVLAGILSFMVLSNFGVITGTISDFIRRLSPFITGFIIAYLLGIPCGAIEQRLGNVASGFVRRKARVLSVTITLLATVALITLTLFIVVPAVVASAQEFSAQIPTYINNIVAFSQTIMGPDFNLINALGLQPFIDDFSVMQIFDIIGYDSIWTFIVGVFGAATFVVNATIAIISAIYILLDAHRMKMFFVWLISSIVPSKTSSVFFKYVSNINLNLKTFIYCMVVDSLIMMTITLFGLTVMRVNFSIILALVIGVTNLVPYFGSIVGSLIIIFMAFLTEDVGTAVMVTVFIIILQQIDANVIKVKLFGDSFNLSPFLVIFSITIGGSYYGVPGMVLAIPIMAIVKTIFNDIMDYRRRVKTMDNRL
ncbi:MAG: AI-2E family transporter [Defluviitaleaceae bacterium]|nr:AI-2E family transporter [Defluviitaleaceae bacterium]